jgi:hypothetical protein
MNDIYNIVGENNKNLLEHGDILTDILKVIFVPY